MADVHLTNAVNIKAVYAAPSLSLFMDLHRQSEVVAMCSNSIVVDSPVRLSLQLCRIGVDDGNSYATLSSSSHQVSSYPLHQDGVGSDAVQFAASGGSLLRVTINLGAFSEWSKQRTPIDVPVAEHALIDQSWMINSCFRLVIRLVAKAHAGWTPGQEAQWNDVTGSRLILTPRSHPCGDDDCSAQGGEVFTRYSSASPSITCRSTMSSFCETLAPRFRLKGPLYIDQALFPIVRILFNPQQYTEAIPIMTTVLRNMTIQVGVERCPPSRSGKPLRRAPRNRSAAENVFVLDRVPAASSTLEDDGRPLPQRHEAICLVFNAHNRQLSNVSPTAYDVACANRLVVDDYVFEVLVTAAWMKNETVETVWRAIQAYHYENPSVDVVDMDIDEAVGAVVQRFSYIKDAPSIDVVGFYNVVWEAMRLYMVTSVISDTPQNDMEDDLDGGEVLINKILMDV